jgi:hypothetical protein
MVAFAVSFDSVGEIVKVFRLRRKEQPSKEREEWWKQPLVETAFKRKETHAQGFTVMIA